MLSWNASVQRAVKYRKDSAERQRKEFRRKVISYCEKEILPHYSSTQSEEKHIENIISLCDYAQAYSDHQLLASPYNIGASQKLLNLQLKYLWCLGLISMPPHCPIDRIVLSYTKLKDHMNWTEISEVSEYREGIKAIREVAGDMALSLWELEIYNRRRD